VYGAQDRATRDPDARDWPSPTKHSRLAAAMRALRGTGHAEHGARALVDRAATHVGPDATAAELFARIRTPLVGSRRRIGERRLLE
jgi:hypothetical protein